MVQVEGTKLYLLGLLGIIPIAIVRNVVYIIAGCLPVPAEAILRAEQKISNGTAYHRFFMTH